MSLPDEFLKGLSRYAITIIALLGRQPGLLSIQEIKDKLPWMTKRVDEAMAEILARPLLLVVRTPEGDKYGID